MLFNTHSQIEGQHAFLSASNYSWINYDEDKLIRSYETSKAKREGVILHDFAARCIALGIRLEDLPLTLNMYVNDCIGYKMRPEQTLFWSPTFFGTSDAIGFRNNKLRIFDYKSGLLPASVHQLEIYAALFCLEYRFKPFELDEIDLRIYQDNEIVAYEGDADAITHIMEKGKTFAGYVTEWREEERA